jgi:hypothetical protein
MNAVIGILMFVALIGVLVYAAYWLFHHADRYDEETQVFYVLAAAFVAVAALTTSLFLAESLGVSRALDKEMLTLHWAVSEKLRTVDAMEDVRFSRIMRQLFAYDIDQVNKRIQRSREYNSGILDAWSVDALGELEEIK